MIPHCFVILSCFIVGQSWLHTFSTGLSISVSTSAKAITKSYKQGPDAHSPIFMFQCTQLSLWLSLSFEFQSRQQSTRYLPNSFMLCVDMMTPYSLSMRRLLIFSDRALLRWWYAGHSVRACSSVSIIRSSQSRRFTNAVIVSSILSQQYLHSFLLGSGWFPTCLFQLSVRGCSI